MSAGERRELQEALSRIQRLSDEHWHELDPSFNLLEQDAWMGPAARKLSDSIHDDRRALRLQLTRAVESARDKLAALPNA